MLLYTYSKSLISIILILVILVIYFYFEYTKKRKNTESASDNIVDRDTVFQTDLFNNSKEATLLLNDHIRHYGEVVHMLFDSLSMNDKLNTENDVNMAIPQIGENIFKIEMSVKKIIVTAGGNVDTADKHFAKSDSKYRVPERVSFETSDNSGSVQYEISFDFLRESLTKLNECWVGIWASYKHDTEEKQREELLKSSLSMLEIIIQVSREYDEMEQKLRT